MDADLAEIRRVPQAHLTVARHREGGGDPDGQPSSQGEKTIAVVLYPGLTALDLIGPLQVLTVLERFAPHYRTVVVGERLEPVDTDVHVQMIPDRTFDEVPHPYALVVPGGRIANHPSDERPGDPRLCAHAPRRRPRSWRRSARAR